MRDSVKRCGRQLKSIALELGVSESKLTRMLAGEAGEMSFPLRRLPDLMRATGDRAPLDWLIASFLVDPRARRQYAVEQLEHLMPFVNELRKESGAQAEAY